jgi:copper chaperone
MELKVQGMTCGHCGAAVERAVKAADPTARVSVDRAAGRVTLENATDPAAIRRATEAEGYSVDPA